MKLDTVIHTILQSNNFITIPGLGSFVSQYHPARIIKSDYVKFIPPRKVIAFNTLIQQNDGILESILQSDYKLSLSEAQKEIDLFVNTTKEILQTSKLYPIQGVGTLYYSDHSILFEPSFQNNSSNQYGLSDFFVHILPQETNINDYVEKKKNELPLHKKIIKTTFILSPVLFAAILIPNIIHAPQMTGIISLFRDTEAYVDFSIPQKPKPILSYKKTEQIEYTPQQENITMSESKETNNVSNNNSKEQQKNNSIVSIPKTQEFYNNSKSQNVNLYIIVGSYSSKTNAQVFLNTIKAQYTQAGILIKDGKIRVFIEKNSNKELTLHALRSIKQKDEFKNAWIYTEKT
jgi:hypothetical protein